MMMLAVPPLLFEAEMGVICDSRILMPSDQWLLASITRSKAWMRMGECRGLSGRSPVALA